MDEHTARERPRDVPLELARMQAQEALFADPRAAVRIGRYLVLERIGAGGMGVVYAAYDPQLERRVALKLLHRQQAGASEQRRLLREATALAKLSHPNVVAVYDAGTVELTDPEAGRLRPPSDLSCPDTATNPHAPTGEQSPAKGTSVFIAMELVEGVTLRRWLEERRSWPDVIDVFAQAGRGLAAAHARGLIHRDFKPDNLIIGHDARARVMDFGLARQHGGGNSAEASVTEIPDASAIGGSIMTRTGAFVGTPAYMAPEQFHGADVDARADQFAFCASLYEALSRSRPFRGSSLAELAYSVTRGEVQPFSRQTRAPAWIQRVVLRGLATDPRLRFCDMGELVAALTRDPAVRRRRWAAAVVTAAIAGVIIIGRQASSEPLPESDRSAPMDSAPPRLAVARQVTRVSEDVQIANAVISQGGASVAYWAAHPEGHWLAIMPTRGAGGVKTKRASSGPELDALRFTRQEEVLSLQAEHDGRIGLFATSASGASEYRGSVTPGLTTGARWGARADAISPRGTAIALADEKRLRVLEVSGSERVVAEVRGHVTQVSWSPDGGRLAWIEDSVDDATPPRMMIAAADGSEHREILSSAGLVRSPCGALTFAGERHLVFAIHGADAGMLISRIWEQELEAGRLAFVGEPRLLQDATPGTPCMLSASDDGRNLAFIRHDRREVIHVARIERTGRLEEPRPMTTDISNESAWGWTADSKRVVFFSLRDSVPGYYTRSLGDESVRMVFEAASPTTMLLGSDRERLLFFQPSQVDGGAASVVSVAPDGTSEVVGFVTELPWLWAPSCAGTRCTYVASEGDEIAVREMFWSAATPRELARFRVSSDTPRSWFLAPDGTRGALLTGNDVYLVSFEGEDAKRLTVPSWDTITQPNLQYAAWTPDGAALYITGMHIDGAVYAMIRLELDGSYELVHSEANRWMRAPQVSPDGRHLVFSAWDFSGQVWELER